MAETIDWPPPPRRRRRRVGIALVIVLLAVMFGGGTALSYYVDALWFNALGFRDVFWTTLDLQALTFVAFGVVTFVALYGAFLALRPAGLADLGRAPTILINGQPIRLPVEPVIRVIALVLAVLIAAASAAGMMANWTTLALYWYAPPASVGPADPVFGRPVAFYLFTLPAWQLLVSWLMTIVVIICGTAIFFVVVAGGARAFGGRRDDPRREGWRGLSLSIALFLLVLAARVYLSRFESIFDDNTIFSGVTYTDAHIMLTGLLIVAWALVAGAVIATINAFGSPRLSWLAAAAAPAVVSYGVVGLLGWYVNSFVVKPNELVRESPYIAANIEWTRQAFGLDRIVGHPFPADAGTDALDFAHNRATFDNIRLWDWHALQDTLRQIQEIRTYYDFPDIDIDRYEVGGSVKEMMLAARELNVDRLPESSRNWINEKLIYTHGYGVTMNPVNGFTPEGLPQLILSNMPVQSTVPALSVDRPELYYGELTDTDVYVRTQQKEFNYPLGESNSLTTYEGNGGIVIGGFLRRALIALDRGDLAKLPFSDDVTSDSRLLMRRNIRDRVETLAPFLTFDPDPYVVIGDDHRFYWMMDAFTTADTYPYARHYAFDSDRVNYMRNSVKAVIDAYDGSVTFYVFDPADPIINAYRAIFPTLFRDRSAMPPALAKHVRYPELLLKMQAAVYGLYHMTNPEVFYNREDLWTVASEVGLNAQGEQATQVLDPNYILMTLPGEQTEEFVGILPFTPANRNNLIGWIAGRSDGANYGTAFVYDFPKTKLIDGPLQIEARIDQNAQLSGQLTLWNQQGSHVLRGTMLVIPVGRGLLYAEPIYLQAERSPMPELRLVVLALQDRLAYAPTFDAALSGLFGQTASTLTATPSSSASSSSAPPTPSPNASAPASQETDTARLAEAARDLADYERLTAEGKLGEAGQKLEALKHALDELTAQRH